MSDQPTLYQPGCAHTLPPNCTICNAWAVPVEPDNVTKEAILLVESILPTDYGWEETAGLRSALGIGDNDE